MTAEENFSLRLRKTRHRVALHQPDHEIDRRFRLVFERLRTKPANLDQPGDRRRRDTDEPPVMRRQQDLVVGDQPREQSKRSDMGYKDEGELCLARAGRSSDHNAAITEHDSAGMEIVCHVRIRRGE